MKDVININEEISIEKNKKRNRTIITLIKGSEKIVLSNLKTDEFFWSDVKYDENYVIVYSRGCMVNQIPLVVECAYNIKTDTIIDTRENRKLGLELEYMYIGKYSFEVGTVLSIINDNRLDIAYEDEIEHLKLYLTNGNDSITDEEIKNYILSCYPMLKKYTNLDSSITVLQYRDLVEEIGRRYISLHKMPQIIDESRNQIIHTLKK